MADRTAQEQKFIGLLEKGDLDAVDLMLSTGEARVTQPVTGYGDQPIHLAAGKGNTLLIELLVRHGADVNAADNDGDTPLMTASKWSQPEAAKKLLELGATRDARAKNGMTALFNAAMEGRLDMVALLVEGGADPNIGTDSGLTPIFAAALRGHLDVARCLVEQGAQLGQKGHGQTVAEFAESIGRAGGNTKRVADFLAGAVVSRDAVEGTSQKTTAMKPLSFKKPPA